MLLRSTTTAPRPLSSSPAPTTEAPRASAVISRGAAASVDSFTSAAKPRPTPGPTTPTTPTTPGKGGSTDGLKDKALIKALHDAAAQHKDLGYNQARKVIFTELDNHDGKVECVYTGRELATNKIPNSSDMNTEHSWPQSKGATGAAKSDLHHLFPTDSKANSIRSSYPFGKVVKDVKWSQDGSKLGKDANGQTVFEPRDEHKGNVARALFYFSTVYGKPIPAGDEAVLKQWNQMDKVDAAEVARNDAIQGYQGNRNPFVDDPSLADRISDF
ncbi:endonuclease I family protein [Archangium primigenium]|uniref:endonuclease I family protein n=1 Tax=[Archangium] primigenium TaxID=2792470 RepID=UPI00195A2696|nr:endonuclease [Archangium primigenium]MBM7118905.1 endonuclease [Archangium primigenium]